jgi:hypothetical protein
MYRSGTSLLRAMLGRHSQLFAGLETQWLHEPSLAGSMERRPWLERMSLFFDLPLSAMERLCGDSDQIERCLEALMSALAEREGKRRWIEKTPGNAGVIDRILSYWPAAKIVHIIRDPRDVYASLLESRKWTEPAAFASRWASTVGLARDWLAAAGGERSAYYELRYERLVLSPAEEMRGLLGFLGEPWESQVASFTGQPDDFKRVLAATGKENRTLQRVAEPLSTRRIGVWRSSFGAKQWAPIQLEIEQRGYGRLLATLIAESDEVFAGNDTRAGATAP